MPLQILGSPGDQVEGELKRCIEEALDGSSADVRAAGAGHFEIEEFLESVKLPGGRKLPFVACLRNSINYSHAADRGLGIWEIAPSKTTHDVEMWEPLLAWLRSRGSRPAA